MKVAFFDHYSLTFRFTGSTLYKTNTYQVIPGLCQFSNEIRTIVTLRNYKQSEETIILHAIYFAKDKT